MAGDRDASGAKFFDDARLGYRMRSLLGCFCGQRIFFSNEFNPAKKCWSALWLCLPNWSSASILTRVRESASSLAAPREDEDDDEHEDE
jgi:hypothetical protein